MSRNQSFALESERSIADLQILTTCRTYYEHAIAVSRIYKFSLPAALMENTLVSRLLSLAFADSTRDPPSFPFSPFGPLPGDRDLRAASSFHRYESTYHRWLLAACPAPLSTAKRIALQGHSLVSSQ